MRAARVAVPLVLVSLALTGCGAAYHDASVPLCPSEDRDSSVLFLMAQSIPSAAFVPCISNLPGGWSFGGERIRNGHTEFWLDSDRAGFRALTVLLTATCDTSKAVEVPPEAGEPLMDRYEEPTALPPSFSGSRYYVFPGGCVTYRFAFAHGATFAQAVEATEALTFVPRTLGVTVLADEGLSLCGRGVVCPG